MCQQRRPVLTARRRASFPAPHLLLPRLIAKPRRAMHRQYVRHSEKSAAQCWLGGRKIKPPLVIIAPARAPISCAAAVIISKENLGCGVLNLLRGAWIARRWGSLRPTDSWHRSCRRCANACWSIHLGFLCIVSPSLFEKSSTVGSHFLRVPYLRSSFRLPRLILIRRGLQPGTDTHIRTHTHAYTHLCVCACVMYSYLSCILAYFFLCFANRFIG